MAFPIRKKIRIGCVLLLGTVLAGCLSDRDSPESCAYGVSQALDSGEWGAALERLDSRACERSMDAPARALNRAAAHIGIAGYEITDLVEVALAEPQPDELPSDLRFIRRLGLLGESPGALRQLDLSLQAHQQVVGGDRDNPGEALLQQECRQQRIEELSEAGKDACFLAGLFAHARFAKALTLLLDGEAQAWRSDEPLSCDRDRNASGVVDGAEITSCALLALGESDAESGTCLPATSESGAVRWEALADYPRLGFRFREWQVATLMPVRVRIEPGPACTGRGVREGYRLLAIDDEPSLAVTDGACGRDLGQRCDGVAPDADCWPCPVPRADGTQVLTLSSTLLSPLNRDAELMVPILPGVEGERVSQRLEETRQRLCEAAEGTEQACDTREDGATLVRQSALGAYFRR